MIPIQLALAAVKTSAEVVARLHNNMKKRDIHNVGALSFSVVRSDAAPVWNTEHSTSVLDHNHTLPMM